jgi:hypothetical protein
MAKKADVIMKMAAFLDELGFQSTADLVRESFDHGDSTTTIMADARKNLDWDWSHSDQDAEAKQAFACARSLIDQSQSMLR